MPINKLGSVQNNINFCGSMSRTDNGNPYYKTNSATKAGTVLAIPAFLIRGSNAFGDAEKSVEKLSNFYKKLGYSDKQIKELIEAAKFSKKYAIPSAIAAAILTVGSGMIVDNIRNSEAKKTADYVRQAGAKRALIENDDIALSYNNRPYKNSSVGKKYGAILGAICGVAASFMTYGKNFIKPANIIGSVIGFALGGLAMGAISDNMTNKDAEKNA